MEADGAMKLLICEWSIPEGEPHFGGSMAPGAEHHALECLACVRSVLPSDFFLDYRFCSWPIREACEWARGGVILMNRQDDADEEPLWRLSGWGTILRESLEWSENAPLVLPAGNGGHDLRKLEWYTHPAIVVGALGSDGDRWYRSNYGDQVDVWHSGRAVNVNSWGTSWSAPRVAGETCKVLGRFGYRDAYAMDALWRRHKTYEHVMDSLDGFPYERDEDGDGHIGFFEYLSFLRSFNKRRRSYP